MLFSGQKYGLEVPGPGNGLILPLPVRWLCPQEAEDWVSWKYLCSILAPSSSTLCLQPTSHAQPSLKTHLRDFHLSFSVWFSGLSLS